MVSLYDDPVLRRMASAPSSNKQNRSTTCILVVSVVIAFVVGALGSWFLHGAIFPSVEQNSSLPVPLGGMPSSGVSSPGTHGQNVKPSKPTKTPGPSPSPPSPSPNTGGVAPKPKEERTLIADMLMSTDVIPEHYELLVKTYLPGYGAPISKEENLTFYGEVDITFKAHKSVDSIRLNSVNLEYDKENSYVKTERGETIQVKSIKIDKKLEIATFTFEKAIPAGTFKFFITYTGLIADTLSGLYQTHYTENGVHKIAAVTQMEATMARQMVPCYDEPRHKASWGVTVIHPRGTRAISNGIEKREAEVQGQFFMRTEFQKTPKMSSYLLAIMVSEFKFIEGYTKNKVRFRIWARPEAMETAKYALKTGIKCLESFEDFFGIKFPLAKQDMVALPDFAMGAMENWGLITYRETALLYDPKNYHYSNKIRVATVISHELAHQWFGNLVTMKWWDDIWLNEGFASFVENIGVDMVNDAAFEMMKDVIDDQLSTTLEVDSKASSNPIIFQVDYKEEIDDLFDPISYDKGGSLLAMINHLLGDRFNEGVTNYLKKYSYQNAEHGDLFREWDNVIPESMKGPNGERLNVTQFALRWTKQMGYPVLTLEHAGSKAKITQQRFKVDPEAKEREKFANPPYGFKWDVPVWIQKGDSGVELKWLPAEGSLEIPVQKGEAVVLNADSYAIARMNYGKEGWENIIKQLKDDNTIYSDRTKYRIIADAFAMALTGRIPYEQAFSLSSYIIKEKAFLPWSALLGEIGKIKDFYGTSYQSKVVDGYKKRLLKPVFDKIDIQNVLEQIVDDASYTATKLPVLQYVSYCHVDPEACKEQIDAFYKDDFAIPCANNNKEASKCTSVPTALRSFVYCEAVKNGDYSTWETFFEKYKIETLQLERTKLMYALTCSQDPATLKILLSAMVNREKEGIIRLQDAGSIAIYIAENPVGAEIVFNYLLANWNSFQKEYSSQQSIINRIIKAFTSVIRTDYGLKQLKDFLAQESSTSKYFTFTTSMQAVQMKLDWVNKRGNDLLLFLKKAKV